MKEILLTSSVLILALLLLRLLFRKTISRQVQYALWGLVALRLLVPVSLPAIEHNVLTAAEPVTARITAPALYVTPYRETIVSAPPGVFQTPAPYQSFRVDTATEDSTVTFTDGKNVTHSIEYKSQIPLTPVLKAVWHAGMYVMAAWFLLANLRFMLRLRRSRRPYPVENCPYPVYLTAELPSPCLFGLFHPAVYLTPAAVESPETLRHVLIHETTHARHLDPLWSLLRCVCLAVYWFDPLVWIAAIVSRRDCELACDEGALRQLGESERIPYGQTLLRLIPVAGRPESPMLSATTMTAGKRELKDRVTRIAENRRTVGVALLAVVAAAALVCALTFTGAKPSVRSLTGEELSGYALAFNSADCWQDSAGNDCGLRPVQFLTSVYDQPRSIDMYQLFYNGVSPEQAVSDAERQEVTDTYYSGSDPEVDLIKITAELADAVLTRWTGLTLAETDALNMGSFSYLSDYDAYYHFHGDTNAPGSVCFYAGERSGDTVTLYYQPEQCGVYLVDTAGSGEEVWAKVTVEPQSGGGLRILSNQICGRPDDLLGVTRPLTGEELAFFNTEFFNHDTDVDGVVRANPHNQFLTCLYAGPQDINLFDLFYNGAGTWDAPSQAELEQLGVLAVDGSQICPTYKLTTAAMDAFLLENTGLTLAQTNKVDLDAFDYLPDYDAYYLTKGDTNYRSVTFTSGEREGSYIRLYWKDFYYGSETNECVTLLDRGEGQYWFVSHLLVDGDIPSAFAYPEEEPWLTIPLDGLRAYEPQKMALARHSDDCAERGAGFIIDSDDGNDTHSVRIYRSTDGNVYAAVMQAEAAGRNGMAEWEADVFFNVSALDGWNDVNDVRLFFFHDLLGHSGFTVSYSDYLTGGPGRGGYIDIVTDYYYLDNSGTPYLLAHAKGDAQLIDLNGDGALELCTASGVSGQIFFLRDGRYYEADVKALLQDAWPEMNYWDHASWDLNYRRLTVRGFVSMPAWATAEHPQPDADFSRYLYYQDGELLVYKPDKDSQTADHVVGTPDVPEPVLTAAKATVQKAYQDYKNGGFDSGADLDNWRVEYLSESWRRAYPTGALIAYDLNYEYHAQKPANVMLAGGAYVDEDGWLMPDYPYCHYLFFIERNGQYTFLEEQMINDAGPGSDIFEAEMQRWAVELGLSSVADTTPEELLFQLYDGMGGQFLTQLSTMSETDRQTVCQKLDVILQEGTAEQQSLYLDAVQTMAWCSHSFDGAQREAYDYFLEHSARSSQAAYRAQAVMDALTGGGAVQMRLEPADGVRGGDYTVGVSDGSGAVRAQGFSGSFYWATASDSDPSGSSITLQSPDGRCTITAWENSSIVRCEEPGETAWLMAASTSSAPYDGNTVFTYLRKWYDEAEFNALVDRLIVPADGRNREELAQSWLDAVGDVTIHQVTPGSKYENSFVQNRVTVESAEPAAGLYDPELLAGQHFTFTNERIFVPGNYRSKEQQTVNSSARAYHGEYGPMPGGGAFLDTRSGLLYQTADGWKGTFAP
ncbi:M56 family metallopeptidase [Dysosmobacter sp.]|uniref:M56 family metallopeptidase n=1 Tax=Dysosmobacter sp. TaxID=2591382 RepID=UPI003AF04E8F